MAANVENDGRQGLTAASWWTVDRSHDPPLRVGATPLLERCIREYSWSEDFALRVLDGYKNFLTYKQTFNDFDTTRLSPSIPIDQMWHQHILDNRNYAKDCELLFGRIMYHDPDGGVDQEARERRIVRTMEAVRLQFDDDYDKEVWNFGVRARDREERDRNMRNDRAANRSNRESESQRSHSPTTNGAVSDGSDENAAANAITIRVHDQIGEETFYRLRRTTRMGTMFRHYASRKGIERRLLRFMLEGVYLEDHETPTSLELEDQDSLDVMLEQSGC